MAPGLTRQTLVFTAPRQVAVREDPLLPPGPGQVLVKTLLSAISAGTELLVYRGEFPPGLAVDATITSLPGEFSHPMSYGYAAVGRVEALGPEVDPGWQGRLVFAFQPHASHFLGATSDLHPLPEDLPPEDAVFLPNLETAVTLVMDGQPLLGEQVGVFGQGVVGLLATALLARFPLASLVTVDRHARRRLASESLGAHATLDPAEADILTRLIYLLQGSRPYPGADLTFELSGHPGALDLAIAATGFHGRVVIGSWYGSKKAELNLGGPFHRSRIRLVSSQVSSIAPEFGGRFNKSRILDWSWEMLKHIRPARLITHRFSLIHADRAFAILDQHPEEAIQVVLTY